MEDEDEVLLVGAEIPSVTITAFVPALAGSENEASPASFAEKAINLDISETVSLCGSSADEVVEEAASAATVACPPVSPDIAVATPREKKQVRFASPIAVSTQNIVLCLLRRKLRALKKCFGMHSFAALAVMWRF